MGLRKRHVKKGNSNVYNSRLFGIIDGAESANHVRNSEAGSQFAWNSKARKLARNAIIEAKYRNVQVIAINATRQMHYM